jgi:23S rRNA pseudouridine1911/1915/1917 synthase
VTHHDIAVLHCDNHLLVAVKPPNLPAQADISGDADMLSLMKAYIKEAYQKPGAVYLGLVHRLDRPVGGLMAFARTSKAAARLSEQLRAHAMQRGYLAIVRGDAAETARLEHLLDRPDGAPQEAALTYTCLSRREGLSLLRIELETGRKHQIRRQLSLSGLPIWGDARYGGGQPGQQIALWGTSLTLTHPTTREALSFESPPPVAYPWSLFVASPGSAYK